MADATVPVFSFVIPAYNEEKYIRRTIEAINSNFSESQGDEYEVILVDNGSTDSTRSIARSLGCTVYEEPDLNISELRNHGASNSHGQIVVFIDSDVSLTDNWRANAIPLVPDLNGKTKQITGSHYRPCPTTPFPVSIWYRAAYENPRESFLPGGHTLVPRPLFDEVGGFDHAFETSEDIDFCHRATDLGIKVIHRPELAVVHWGDPQSIGDFLRRECWHGGNDFRSIRRIFQSKPALATLAFAGAHLALIYSIIASSSIVGLIGLGAIVALLVYTSFSLYPKSDIGLRIANSAVAYLYYIGRLCSTKSLFRRMRRTRS